jgi:glutamine amidotransferase/cyclase
LQISLGSDSVYAAESLIANGGKKKGDSSIETISHVYGAQAVVISIDPKRVYVKSKDEADEKHVVVELDENDAGPNGEKFCWYQCTVKGGREARDICAVTVAKATQQLGGGEIMLNCIDMDGQGKGYDLPLMRAVSIPVIASSGAGNESHLVEVFQKTPVQAALAAGMFHRKEIEIEACKTAMRNSGIPARTSCAKF